jgi:mannose-1-phosphate guanylyltransferase
VAGSTLIERIAATLAEHRIRDLILNLHHLPETITAILGDGSGHGVRVRYSFERPLLGSGGGPRRAFSLVDDPRLWLVNGDTLARVDLAAMAAAHATSEALVTMALIPNPDPAHYGGVLVDDAGVVTGFTRRGAVSASWHFVGVQIAERMAFESLADGVPRETVGGLYPELMASRRGSVRGFLTDSPFLDIGTVADYLAASLSLASSEDPRALIDRHAAVAPDAMLRSTIVWDDVRVGAGATLSHCVITSGVDIPPGFTAEWQVIEPGNGGGRGPLQLTPIEGRER